MTIIDRKAFFKSILTYSVLLLVFLYAMYLLVFVYTRWERLGTLEVIWTNIMRFFPPSIIGAIHEHNLIKATLDTMAIAIISTVFTAIISIPIIVIAADNITINKITYNIGRIIIILSRSIHEIVWGLIFVIAVGLGPFAGVLALGIRGIGFVAKVVAEEVENIDMKPLEAMRSAGANKLKVVAYAVIPQIMPVFLGTVIFQWDLNIRRAAIIGIVGAGGLGLAFHQAMMQFKWNDATGIVVILALLVIAGEVLSKTIRERIIQ